MFDRLKDGIESIRVSRQLSSQEKKDIATESEGFFLSEEIVIESESESDQSESDQIGSNQIESNQKEAE